MENSNTNIHLSGNAPLHKERVARPRSTVGRFQFKWILCSGLALVRKVGGHLFSGIMG